MGGRGANKNGGRRFLGSRSLSDNLPELTKKYPLSEGGYFGRASNRTSNNRVRQIVSQNPIKTASDFYKHATAGAVSEKSIPSGKTSFLRDGTVITLRKISSSDGYPAVDIKIMTPGTVKTHKIHFLKGQ